MKSFNRYHYHSNNHYRRTHTHHVHSLQRRWYTPLTPKQEEEEKIRLSHLTDAAKEAELRQLNRDIARLEMLRGLNTGDLYTWSGRYKLLARDYGVPFMVYYWVVWMSTFAASYLAMEWGQVDVLSILYKLDGWTGFDISGHVRPEYGKIGLALVLNEVLELGRLPFVIVTVKPLMDHLYPTKY